MSYERSSVSVLTLTCIQPILTIRMLSSFPLHVKNCIFVGFTTVYMLTMTAASAKKSSKMAPQKSPHPATSEMVIAAIKTLNEKKGSSLHAIKKYIAATYVVDAKKLAPFIKKYLRNSVEKKTIVQTSGVGASGRFKKPVAIKPDVKKVEKNAAKSTATKPDGKKVKKSAAKSIATKSGGKKVQKSAAKSIATKSGGKVTKKRTGKSINKSLAKPKANKLVKSAKTKKLPATAKVAKPKLAKK
ncbi:histone H1-like [Copidosoma floridanum]|uniref:histone H1-like n=1 Tax=Copidosoma floridanum TaxID=29053 RepID=UPI000C6FC505|nr:histone H1-like [Copidosoma floridanum]